jgi:hypothetical protein
MKHFFIGLIGLPTLLFCTEYSVAYVKVLKGDVTLTHRDNTTKHAKEGDKIFENDVIKTAANSLVGITFEDNTRISIGSNAEFSIDEYLFEPASKNVAFKSNLLKGTMGCVTGLIPKIKPDAMEIKAKTATIGIRGTSFVVEVKE